MISQVNVGYYTTLNDAQLDSEVGSIIQLTKDSGMSGSLTTLLTEATSFHTNYTAAYIQSKTGNRVAIAQKNAIKISLVNSMEKLAIGVNYFSMGDEAKQNETGMPRKQKGSPVILQKPMGIAAVNCNNSGCVKVTLREAVGAKSFIYQYTTDPVTDASVWSSEGSSGKNYMFEGLTPGRTYWFRVLAIGSRKQQLNSEAIHCMVI